MTIRHASKALAAAFMAAALIFASNGARAEDLSAKQILDGLKVSKTRSMSVVSEPSAMSSEDLAFIKRIRGQARSLSLDDRDRVAAIAEKRPKVNLDINFDYNSAALTPRAQPQLHNLGKALTSKELEGSVVMLGGHTDAKGSDDYNQGLSERRAETVKRFLIENYRIAAANLVSAGYGKKGPKNPNNLFAAENRRVEIVNMAEREEASK